jgi:cytoskeleton protein RodZ
LLAKLKSPIAALVTLVIFLALLAFIAYRYNQSLDYPGGDYSNATVQEGSSPLKGATTVAEEDTVSAPQEESGVRVAVRVVYTAVGLDILEDGESVYTQVSEPGFSEEFEAEEAITIIAADAGAVQVEVNGGDPEPLGTSGEPVTRTFTADSEG